MKLLAISLGFVLTACAADGEVKVKASSDEDTKASASFSESGSANAKATASTPAEDNASAAPAQTTSAPVPTATCPLVCNVAQKGRVAPAEEQRLTGELADVMGALRSCGQGRVTPSLTLRFDSTAALTGFGVDAERGNEGACVDSVRQRRPNVTFQGPATLRCAERCGGESTRSNRRRR